MAGPAQEILASVRDEAAARFAANGWPGPAAEAWRFTNVNQLGARGLTPADGVDHAERQLGKGEYGEVQLYFHNGVYQSGSSDKPPAGVELVRLEDDAGMARLLDHGKLRDHPVADRTLAAMTGGIGLRVDGRADKPVHLVFRSTGDDTSTHPVVVLDMAAGAEAAVFERHEGGGTGLSMPVMAVNMGERAGLDHVRVQEEDSGRHHLGHAVLTLAKAARYRGISVQTGAILSRCESHFSLAGENADASLTTLYLAAGGQVMDVTSSVAHEAPSCHSMQVVRGVLDGKARGVFQGKVLVAPGAQGTDGNQMSRALLLSRECEADAKPELEIYADDVACSHGATVGEIEDDHLFYLMSRGVPAPEARRMLIEAFIDDAMAEAGDAAMREFAMGPVAAWMGRLKEAGGGGTR